VELLFAFDKEKIKIDQVLTNTNLFSQFSETSITDIESYVSDPYNYFYCENAIIEAGKAPIFGNQPLVQFSGEYLGEDVDCADFRIISLYLGDEFKRDYYDGESDSVFLCATVKNEEDRTLTLATKNQKYEAKADTLDIDYSLFVSNVKNLSSFTINLECLTETNLAEMNNVNLELNNINENLFEYYIKNQNNLQKEIEIKIKDGAELSDSNYFGKIRISRNGNDSLRFNLASNISDINENSCSMNNVENIAEVFFEKKVSICDSFENDEIVVIQNGSNVIINSNNIIKKIKLFNLLGYELLSLDEIENNYSELVLNSLNKGVYILRIETNNEFKINKIVIN
jgi:hypothetical protein